MATKTRETIKIKQPVGGIERSWAFRNQDPFTLSDSLNCRCRDVFESRVRLGSRPGLVNAFNQQIGGTIEFFTIAISATAHMAMSSYCYNKHISATLLRQTFGYVYLRKVAVEDGLCAFPPSDDFVFVPSDARHLFHFDLSAIPDGATIVEADLKLTTLSGGYSTYGGTSGRGCRLTETDWVPSEVTWNSKSSNVLWATAGGTHTTAQQFTWSERVLDFAYRQYLHGVGPLVVDAITNRQKQLHLLLISTAPTVYDGNYISYWSMGSGVNIPKIIIKYEVLV